MAKGNAVKLQTLLDNLKVITIINTPSGDNGPNYLALFSTDPGADLSGTEVNYSGYARQSITFGDPALNGGMAEIKNTNEIEFPTVQASSGQLTHVAILTAATGGQLLYYAALGHSYSLNQGVKPTVPIGSLTVYEV